MHWARHIDGELGAKTARRYGVTFKMVDHIIGDKLIHEINGKTIVEIIEFRKRRKVSGATIRRDLTAISAVLEYAEYREWREGNPTLSKRRQVKERRDPIMLPQPDAIETVISYASPRFGAFIRAAWLTGCRQDELVKAEWRGFNEKARTLEVIGKGNKRRVIALSVKAAALIKSIPPVGGSPLIFCKDTGDMLAQPASDFSYVRRLATDVEKNRGRVVQRFRFHDLRHLYAVEELRAGRSIYDLSKHLGHTSVKTTEIYLAFLTPEEEATAKKGSIPKDGTAQIILETAGADFRIRNNRFD